VRRRVGGEQRIEVISPTTDAYSDAMPGGTLQNLGFQIERIQYKARAFLATGEKGVPALDRFMRGKRIVNVTMERQQRSANATVWWENHPPTIKSLIQEFREFGLGQVKLAFQPRFAHPGEFSADAFGRMAITIGNTINPRWTLGHEAIHVYRHMGLFTDAEWAALSETAKTDWLERYDIKARYPDLTRDEQIEEAVAEAFGEAYARKKNLPPPGAIRTAFRKISNFLKAVKSWAKGRGMRTSADIFDALAGGEFAKRKRPKGWTSQTERLMKQQRRSARPRSSLHQLGS
jgi:hypothetical protein